MFLPSSPIHRPVSNHFTLPAASLPPFPRPVSSPFTATRLFVRLEQVKQEAQAKLESGKEVRLARALPCGWCGARLDVGLGRSGSPALEF